MGFDLFNWRDWLYHYEIVITRQGRDQLLARVPSRWAAEHAVSRARRDLEVSRQAISWRRVRGIHPRRLAVLVSLPVLVVIGMPWLWVRLGLGVVGVAIICGLLTSGTNWMQGGEDDR